METSGKGIKLRDLSEPSRGGGEGGRCKQRDGHNFLRLKKGRGHEKWAVKRGRVMQIYAREIHQQNKKEVLYLLKKRKKEKKQSNQNKNNGTLWI